MEKLPERRRRDFSVQARWISGVIAVTGLLLVFLFQRFNPVYWILGHPGSPIQEFLVNRAVRFIANDIFAVLLVLSLFGNRTYVVVAILVQVCGLFFILLPYVILKLNFPSYNGPLLSFLHRLTLNPLLVYLLIFFLGYQQQQEVEKNEP
jgi:predicted permease